MTVSNAIKLGNQAVEAGKKLSYLNHLKLGSTAVGGQGEETRVMKILTRALTQIKKLKETQDKNEELSSEFKLGMGKTYNLLRDKLHTIDGLKNIKKIRELVNFLQIRRLNGESTKLPDNVQNQLDAYNTLSIGMHYMLDVLATNGTISAESKQTT